MLKTHQLKPRCLQTISIMNQTIQYTGYNSETERLKPLRKTDYFNTLNFYGRQPLAEAGIKLVHTA